MYRKICFFFVAVVCCCFQEPNLKEKTKITSFFYFIHSEILYGADLFSLYCPTFLENWEFVFSFDYF